MHLNYLILAHNNLAQLDLLIDSLDNDKTSFFIHVDKKVPAAEIKKYRFYRNSRVKITGNRISINWAGFSMIQATLLLMKAAIAAKKKGYFILLSGQDMPVKCNEYIYDHLHANYGKEYINFWTIPYSGWGRDGGAHRINYYWLIDKIGYEESHVLYILQRKVNLKRAFFKDFAPYGGSQWWCLTHDCIKYILKYIKFNPVIMDYFELTAFADEIFFQSIVLNSPLQDHIVNDNLRYIDFQDGESHPKILTADDIPVAIRSDKLWARKFDFQHNSIIFEELANQLKT
ncbi:hypothetical protein A3860_09065 [Niastella vici]|uniref:Peptide O-xylosyltransferase n=1 Tax=Niastella vici TaxID=1703345 RepID=A0A1V9FHS9_9BACT|nr:beta-1,6-N-acetylglucosaminyltransferase [Niastella vici]OQP57766.1 hypothetical protein A3860_09065 [Niastella vici]